VKYLRQLFFYLQAKIKLWRDRRFLKRHGCDSWDEYNYRHDPDRNIRCSRVRDYYHGYPYWHVFESREHYCYKLLYDHGPAGFRYGYHDMLDWCTAHATGKHRLDFLRVIKFPSTNNEWEMNEIGGGDHIFIAFKNERDFFYFMLKWA
jgi:hypothetical protein